MSGLVIPDLLKAQALENLVPDALLQAIVSRPELADYAPKLRWVKAQMEHARGAAQAQHASGSEKELHSVDAEQYSPLVWHFQEAIQRCAEANDWTGLAAATAALYAFTGGKGKGGKGGKGDKVCKKGANRDGSAFTGDCYHCGETGHRKFECPKADDGKPDKGKGKNGKGGKGKGKGGKSLDYAGVDAGTEQAAAAPAAEEELWMGAQ